MAVNAVQQLKTNELGYKSGPISLRLSDEKDGAFLLSVYNDSRHEEMLKVEYWTETDKLNFLQFQFKAQDKHYREHYPTAEYLIIQLADVDVGRLYIERNPGDIRIMDIAILRPFRRKGLARQLINDILIEATNTKSKVSLHVESDNLAKQLYLSLGFKVVGEISFYERMEWKS